MSTAGPLGGWGKGMSSKEQNRRQRADLARLKKLGLYRGNARKNPTRYGKSLIKKYADVLAGKAAVVKAPSKAAARAYRDEGSKAPGTVRVSGDRIVVPKLRGEKLRYDKKRKEVIGYWKDKATGKTYKKHVTKTGTDLETFSKRDDIIYSLLWMRGSEAERMFFSQYKELLNFIEPYGGMKRLGRYVEILDADAIEDGDE